MNENVYNSALALLRDFEGLRLSPYYCSANKRTIGYGHRILKNETNLLRTITKDEAEKLLRADFDKVLLPIYDYFSKSAGCLADCEYCALALFAFNCGLSVVLDKLSSNIKTFMLLRASCSKNVLTERAKLFYRMRQYVHYHDKNGHVCVSSVLKERRDKEIHFFCGSI